MTLRQSDPLPFWKAIDQLCDAAQLQYNLSDAYRRRTARADFLLERWLDADDHAELGSRPVSASACSGSDYEAILDFAGVGVGPGLDEPQVGNAPARRPLAGRSSRPTPVLSDQFTAHLLVAAEPRLSVSQTRRASRARGGGQSGQPPDSLCQRRPGLQPLSRLLRHDEWIGHAAPGPAPSARGAPAKRSRNSAASFPCPSLPGDPDPLVVPLDQATGKRFENPDVELTIHDIRTMPNTRQTLIELSVKPKDRGTIAERIESDPFSDVYRSDMQRLQLEIIDSRGQIVPSSPRRRFRDSPPDPLGEQPARVGFAQRAALLHPDARHGQRSLRVQRHPHAVTWTVVKQGAQARDRARQSVVARPS